MIKINKKEWKLVSWVWLVIVFLTFLPTIIGVINTPLDSIFLGRQGINSNDLSVYYSNIEQAKEGDFLFKNLFTSETHPRFIFDPFWLGVGILAKVFSLSSFLAFQITKFLLIPIFLIVSYYLVAFFFQEEIKRKACFIFLIFASGLGVFYIRSLVDSFGILNIPVDQWGTTIMPIDLWVPEAFTFLSIYNSPHFLTSLTLIILIFLLSLLAFENYKLIYSLGAGFSALFLFQFHPYHLLMIFGVLGVFIFISIFKEKRLNFNYLKHYFILLIFSLPPVIYHFWALEKIWVRKAHFLQNICITPHLAMVLIGYGFLIPLSLIGSFYILKKKETSLVGGCAEEAKNKKYIFLFSWVFIQFSLIYFPLSFQRRLIEGFQIALVILTIFGLFYLRDYLEKKPIFQKYFKKIFFNKIFLIFLFFILFFFSNFLIIINDLSLYLGNYSSMYSKKEVQEAMLWLRENTKEENVIFSLYENGNLIPAFSLRQVYLGHGHQTAEFEEKISEVEKFFQKSNDDEKITFLKENKIDYLFFGSEEKKESQFNPDEKNYLEKVFSNNEVVIYKISY